MINPRELMKRCVAKAATAKGFTKTNPLVGAAVVKNGHIVSIGIHENFGDAHAEVNALNSAIGETKGSDLYVTLEPCSSFGKTPPCVDKIIECGIKRVFIGVVDVNSKHAGKGIYRLKEAGIEVKVGIALNECSLLVEDFIKSQTERIPYVTLKTAVSADGKTASFSGDSKWITGLAARKLVHKMRGLADIVLTGIGTVYADDPMLNNRNKNARRQPARAVLDSLCKIPLESALVKSARDIPLFVYVGEDADKENILKISDMGARVITVEGGLGGLDMNSVLKSMYMFDMMNVFVEAGAKVAGTFHDQDMIDRLEEFIAPKLIGGGQAPSAFGGRGTEFVKDARPFLSAKVRKVGEDFLLSARINDYAGIAQAATCPFMEDN